MSTEERFDALCERLKSGEWTDADMGFMEQLRAVDSEHCPPTDQDKIDELRGENSSLRAQLATARTSLALLSGVESAAVADLTAQLHAAWEKLRTERAAIAELQARRCQNCVSWTSRGGGACRTYGNYSVSAEHYCSDWEAKDEHRAVDWP